MDYFVSWVFGAIVVFVCLVPVAILLGCRYEFGEIRQILSQAGSFSEGIKEAKPHIVRILKVTAILLLAFAMLSLIHEWLHPF